MNNVYQHPDGHSIDFTDNTLTVTNSGGQSVSVPIGTYGLLTLVDSLEAVAGTAKEFSAADCAEHAGAAIASNCLDSILASETQAESVCILEAAINGLGSIKHRDRAVRGFAAVLISAIEQGLNAAGQGVNQHGKQ